jgi:hypothetical protein
LPRTHRVLQPVPAESRGAAERQSATLKCSCLLDPSMLNPFRVRTMDVFSQGDAALARAIVCISLRAFYAP